MIIYFSGYGCNKSDPERFLGDRANIMLTYYDSHKRQKPEKRFAGVHKARKRRQREVEK